MGKDEWTDANREGPNITKADVAFEMEDLWPTRISELHELGHSKTDAPGSPRSVYLEGIEP